MPPESSLFVANYIGGSIAVVPILPDGRLEPACFVQGDTGSLGPKHAASGPPGSFAISGHDAPHAHMIQADPQNRFVLYSDLGQDRIYINKFDAKQRPPDAGGNPVRESSRGRRTQAFRVSPEWEVVLLHSGRSFDGCVFPIRRADRRSRPSADDFRSASGIRGDELLLRRS